MGTGPYVYVWKCSTSSFLNHLERTCIPPEGVWGGGCCVFKGEMCR